MNDLKEYLEKNSITAKIIDLGVAMPTALAAAEKLNVSVGSIFKSLVLTSSTNESIVVVLPGDKKINIKAVEKLLSLTKLKFSSSDVVLEETGFPAGGTPPIGHKNNLKVVIDTEIMIYEMGYGGGGRHELLLEISPDELVRASGGIVASVAKRTEEDKIKKILIDDLFVDIPLEEIKIDDDLREVIGLDSLSFMELRVQSENFFNIEITDDEFIPENFGTIRKLVAMIKTKKNSSN